MWTDLLFDLDGTLTDPGEGITGSVRYAMQQMNFPVPPQAVLDGFVGPPLDESFSAVCGFTGEQIDESVRHFRAYFAETGHAGVRPFDGMKELLANLVAAGCKLYLATSKPLPLAKQVLERFEMDGYFTLLVGSDIAHNGRAKAEVVREVLDTAGINPANAVMIGDRRYDIIGAHENGLPCIAVLFGYGSRQEFAEAGADYVAEDIPALRTLLLG